MKDRILILIMSCREKFFQNEVRRILDTWGSKHSENIDIMYYDGGWQEDGIDGNHIKSSSADTLDYTYLKTYDALAQVMQLNKYKWIFRVNTSTYVNIPLLEKFVECVANEDILYASELYSLTEACCPEPLDIYARGNAFLISAKMACILLHEGINLLFLKIVDDVSIGNVLNSYYIKQSKQHNEYLSHISGIPHAWYKAVDVEFDCGHALSTYGKCGNMEYYNDFITVQTKMYRRRGEEDENMKALWNMMKDAPEPSLDVTLKYMKDPSVFIGSAVGYIPLSTWKKIPKNKLYDYEMQHKAIDDKQNPNFSQEAYDKLHSFK